MIKLLKIIFIIIAFALVIYLAIITAKMMLHLRTIEPVNITALKIKMALTG